MSEAYIVDAEILKTSPPQGMEWHAVEIPGDPTKCMVVVDWTNPNLEAEFEQLEGVLRLGSPWEPLPDEAVALLASFQEDVGTKASLPEGAAAVAPVPAPSVKTALRSIGWPGARLVR